MTTKSKYGLILYGILLSTGIALIAFLFLILEKVSSHFLWHSLPHHLKSSGLYHFLLLFSGFLLLLFLKKKWGSLPKTSHDLIHELKEKQTVNYHHTWKSLLLALIILSLGAGVGPEAPLLGAVIAYSIWQADKMRYLSQHLDDFKTAKLTQKLAILFHPYQYLTNYQESATLLGAKQRKLLIGLFSLNGLIVLSLLMKTTDQPSFITKLGTSQWGLSELLLLIPLLTYAYGFGAIYQLIRSKMKKQIEKLQLSLVTKLGIGAISIFIIASFAPSLLFSGQHSMHDLVELGMTTPFISLIFLSILKLIFLDICVWTGWTGGDIFPISFAAIMHGFAIAHYFPNYDALFIILVVALSLAISLLEKEWLAAIFISLFFPINLWPISILITFLFILSKQFTSSHQKGDSHETL